MTAKEAMAYDLEKKSIEISTSLMAKKEAHKKACIDLYYVWERRLYEVSGFANFHAYHRWLGIDSETASAMVGFGFSLLHKEDFQ